MSLDDITRNFQSNLPTITFFFGILTVLIRLALKKNREHIDSTVKSSEGRICNEITNVKNDLGNMKDDVERHERWFETFFAKYIKGMNDRSYRESVKKSGEESNEFT